MVACMHCVVLYCIICHNIAAEFSKRTEVSKTWRHGAWLLINKDSKYVVERSAEHHTLCNSSLLASSIRTIQWKQGFAEWLLQMAFES